MSSDIQSLTVPVTNRSVIRQRWMLFALVGLLVIVVLGGVGALASRFLTQHSTAANPPIYRPVGFLWSIDTHKQSLLVPITSGNPGIRTSLTLNHERGFGQALTGANLYATAVTLGNRLMADVIAHMQSNGWKVLFPPTATGSFPTYEFYTTFKYQSSYCFMAYSGVRLDQSSGTQLFDIYHP